MNKSLLIQSLLFTALVGCSQKPAPVVPGTVPTVSGAKVKYKVLAYMNSDNRVTYMTNEVTSYKTKVYFIDNATGKNIIIANAAIIIEEQ